MLMRPIKAETAVHGCHCQGDMAVRMRKVLARPWVGVRVCHLLLLLLRIYILAGSSMVPFANMKMKCQSWPEMPLILERSGTQCVAMVTKLLSSNCGAHLIDHTLQNETISPLHDPVTWYGINYAATQITQWGFQNKGKSGWTGNASPPGYVINNAKCNTNRKCNN